MSKYLERMAKAKRRAKPRRTSSAGRPAGGKLGAGRGKAPARAGAAAARKAAAGKATGKMPSKKAPPVRASSGKSPKPAEVKRTVKTTGGSPPKVSPSRAKAISGTRPDSAGSLGPGPSVPAKAARKPEARPATPVGGAADVHRPSSEGSASERSSETTAQGFAPAAPVAASEGQHNAGASAELPVPIASFTI